MSERWLSTTETAARLGVKPETVYAYVSRGLLPRHHGPDGRASLFDPADVDRLAARARRPQPPAPTESPGAAPPLEIRSGLTEIRDGASLRYRGHDVAELAASATFERVAELLWTGVLPEEASWLPAADAAGLVADLARLLPTGTPPLLRLRLAADAADAADPLRGDLRPDAVRAAARSLIATLPQALPLATSGPPRRQPEAVAARLWHALAPAPPRRGWVEALDAALVVLADHELAASTLAVRAAASTRADPYAVVSTGLAALGGPRHGAAGLGVEELLAGIDGPAEVGPAIARWLTRHDTLPGFGHRLYRTADPRAVIVLDRLRAVAAPAAPTGAAARLAVVERLLAVARERGLPAPNIDLALAALTHVAGMPPGSAGAVFGLARCAGWVAHAMEQYAEPALLRPRARYIGPAR